MARSETWISRCTHKNYCNYTKKCRYKRILSSRKKRALYVVLCESEEPCTSKTWYPQYLDLRKALGIPKTERRKEKTKIE